ncbi:hypothetical protein AB0D08_35360 [Kitasatospora sp. NPDC048540]|uniref:hypothetical protein n=1 Tax=unclassified Kitasatospora TaxID=2633591 RepID=UPI0006EBB499|nr:hypothetical protein [Kitasatospora sp. MBT63]
MFKGSTAVPSGVASRAVGASVLVVSGALVLGSCSLAGPLGGGPGAPSEPARVESRADALTRVERVQDHVRELTGLERNLWIKIIAYEKCPGRGMGIAGEGEPYRLSSAIQLETTDDRRPEVLRALRERLAGEGFKITAAESGSAARSASPTSDFEAVNESDRYTVSLMGGAKPGQGVGVVVTLPCQAPPTGAASPAPATTA